MADNDLTFESTTDSPEQMREGMGLPAETSTPAVESSVAPETEPTTVTAAAGEAAPDAAAASVETPAEPVAEPAKPVRAKDPVTGKFIATPKPDPVAEERALRTTAELERDALRRRVEELATSAPKPEVVAAPPIPAIDPETYRDPAITAKFAAARTAIGAEPKQEDFEDYTEFRKAERAYDRKHAALDARETDAHVRAGEAAREAATAGVRAVTQQFDTFAERQVATRARHADYDAVMEAGKKIKFAGRPFADDIQAAIIEMEEGPELVYFIAKHPEELDKISKQPSARLALAALGRLATVATAAVSAATAPAGATQTGPTTTVVAASKAPVSRAPEPQGTTLGGGASLTATTPENAKDYQEYKRIREQQIRGRFVR